MLIPNGLMVMIHPLLSIDETVLVCDIETKEEVRLLTGKKINCIKTDNKLMVSASLYEDIKNNYEK